MSASLDAASSSEFALHAESLALATGLSRLTLQIAWSRGLRTPEAIEAFLSPGLDGLTHFSRIRDLEKAARRLADARERGERIELFGDYDVDGTSGTALLSWVLRDLGFEFGASQPDRFKDGYGLNTGAVEAAHAAGARVLVTIDCGITGFAPLARANDLGIDAIIVDHHQLDATRGLPEAFAIVNPQRPDCESGLKQLCGCALAFYLAMGLRAEGRARGWFGSTPDADGKLLRGLREPNLKQHLDLVVIGTAADLVPLTGDNHILTRHGLQVLKQSPKPGVRALLGAAGLSTRELSPGHLGFTIGPRINASGRMGSASTALELLSTSDEARAAELAHQLETINAERARVQNAIWDEVREQVQGEIARGLHTHSVVVGSDRWHEGVVGIVASRVVDTFKRPAVVIGFRDGGAKGSARSYGGRSVLQALRDSARFLVGFGGHAHAAGLSLLPADLETFREAFDQAIAAQAALATAASGAQPGGRFAEYKIDAHCGLEDLTLRTLQEIERLGPFGTGNPDPVVCVRARVSGTRVIKERHLKVWLEADTARDRMEGIWFGAAEDSNRLSALKQTQAQRDLCEWRVIPEINRFRGSVTPNLRIKECLS